MGKTNKISRQLARRMAINAQLLNGHAKLPRGKEGVAQAIEKLGYVQIDTIAVIERAHHHTLWTRRPDYNPEMLDKLLAVDRRVFEYWGHAASYLPIRDYRYYIPRMRGFLDPHNKWEKQRLKKFGHMMKPVMERIRKEGPLGSKDFAPPKDSRRGTWWDWRPAKVALELLFWRGELMITERRKFHRIYDLTERVLPKDIDTTIPDDRELGRFLVERALNAYGIATEPEIREHLSMSVKKTVGMVVPEMIENGDIVAIEVNGIDNGKYYALGSKIESLAKLRKTSPRLHILSPFDNLIIQRERTLKLFGFDYALECYVPAPKRKFGYFVLPILWGEELVGRLDPKADRKAKTLIIRSLLLEDGFDDHEGLLPPLAKKLWEMARFNGCEKVVIMKTRPAGINKELIRLL